MTQIFDHHFVEFEYADGSRCYSQCRHIKGCWNSVSEFVTGTKGRANLGGYQLQDLNGETTWRHRGRDDNNPYQQEHDDLFAAIRAGATDYNEAEYGAKSTMTSILGRLVTYSGQSISWDDAINSEVNLMPDKYSWDALPKVLPDENGFYPIAVPGKTKVL